jgi:hypothetical protein
LTAIPNLFVGVEVKMFFKRFVVVVVKLFLIYNRFVIVIVVVVVKLFSISNLFVIVVVVVVVEIFSYHCQSRFHSALKLL